VEEWTAAQINYPMTTGDHLWTDTGARAELHIGSTAIRMDQQTALSILNLNDQIVQLSVTQGSVNVHIRYLAPNDSFEVDTPNASILLVQPGDYRVNADGDNNVSTVIVRAGSADVNAGPAGPFTVRATQSARLAGIDNVSQELSGAPPADEFDAWTRDRDFREDRALQSARYVPREMIGYEDLDAYGRWMNIPPYGWVWQPASVSPGWAPYHTGHWAWIEPWGWTWIDDAPWGFAPFHYGRWAYAGPGWVWIPGAITVRPVYSPALVAFVGGGGFAVGIGRGPVMAWFALGPGEVYRPAYHVSEVYVRNVNVAYVRDVTVINRVEVTNVTYVNQRVVGAVTVVPHDVFVSARPVAAAAVVVPQREIVSARVVGYTAPVAPERVSVVGVAVVGHAPPARFVERTVVVRSAPPPPPVPFAARQEALRANPGRPLDAMELNRLRAAAPPRQPMVRPVGQPVNTGPRPQTPMMRNDRPLNAPPRSFGNGGQVPRPMEQPNARPAEAQPRSFGNPAPGPANAPAKPGPQSNARPAETQPNAAQQPRTFGRGAANQEHKSNERPRNQKKEERTEKRERQ
jgi:hypothetical protein